MAYTRTQWQNGNTPALNADNLNHIEEGIYDAHAFIASLEVQKEDKTNVYLDRTSELSNVAEFLNADMALICGHYMILNLNLNSVGNTSSVARVSEAYRPSHNIFTTPSSGGSSFTPLKAYVDTDGYIYIFTCGSGSPPTGAPSGTTATLVWKV